MNILHKSHERKHLGTTSILWHVKWTIKETNTREKYLEIIALIAARTKNVKIALSMMNVKKPL